MARIAFVRLLPGYHAESDLLVRHGVISSQRVDLAAPDQIASRIAHVRHGHLVVPQQARHDRRGHAGTCATRPKGHLKHSPVSLLHQPPQKAERWFSAARLAEVSEHAFYRRVRRDFPLRLAADAVREHEKPAMRAPSLRCRSLRVPKIIFVVRPYAPNVGK